MGESERPVRGFADAITNDDLEAGLECCHPEIEFLSVLAVSGRAYVPDDAVFATGAPEPAFPADGMELTHLLVVGDLDRAQRWYEDVLGASLHREYGGDSAVLRFLGNWLLLVLGGGPTEDKPGLSMAAPDRPEVVDHSFTIRVPDCRAAYETLRERGAEFLTPPHEQGGETRCFLRDPDGHLFEISQYG
jgi:catechol 2,3-dioxygenase-like lactoylglutathione lyase family enzyme